VESETEHLLLLAHHIGAALVRRLAGDEWPEVRHHFVTQFFSHPWDKLANEDDPGGDTPSSRRELLEKAAALLKKIFADQELAAPFLDMDTLSGMMGTYELVNMCISIPHPLNTQKAGIAELLQGNALASLHALQKGVDDESDEEDSDDEEDDEETQAADGQEIPEAVAEASADKNKALSEEEQIADALQAVKDGTLFAHVVGTSLCEALVPEPLLSAKCAHRIRDICHT